MAVNKKLVPTDANEASARGLHPVLHETGFIELDLGDKHALHVWHPQISLLFAQPLVVHDHTYDFEAEVLLGQFVSTSYLLRNIGQSRLKAEDLIPDKIKILDRGMSYSLSAGQFHDARGGDMANGSTIVLLRKTREGVTVQPRVIRRKPVDTPCISSASVWAALGNALVAYDEKRRAAADATAA